MGIGAEGSFCNEASDNFNGYPAFQSEMIADDLYGNPGYSWDDYIEA